MRKISLWAKHHRIPAIGLIIVLKVMLFFAAFFIGRSLLDMNIHIPLATCAIILPLLALAIWRYPRKDMRGVTKKQFYIRQKSCDFAVALCSFVMIGTLVNAELLLPGATTSYASNSITTSKHPTAEEILASLKYRDKGSLTKSEKRILKREFRKRLKIYIKAKIAGKKDESDKSLLILLTIIAALGLLVLLMGLCCSLSCSGAEGAAVVVGLIGGIAIIWGAVAVIRRIQRGPTKKVIVPQPDTDI